MDLSFHQKSLWLQFVTLTCAFGFYFATALRIQTVNIMPPQVGLFMVAVVALVVVQIVGHIVIAIADRRPQTDERDRLIALKGIRNGSYALATGVCLALFTALVTEGNFVFAHVLLGFWVVAQLVEIGSQLVLYHRGA
jgi:hypothetical protein